jgi:hypothetical protein
VANDTVVAIPVRDEAERIGACLTALNEQTRRPETVVLLLNNCSDETAAIARAMAPRLRFRLDVSIRHLPTEQANAGHARRLAMQRAAEHTDAHGVLLTTDADSLVPHDWIARNLAALRHGADIVCGRAVIDPADAALIPAHLHADDDLECRLIGLLDDLAWILDPEPHDPPPRHAEASGASLAVRAEAYHQVGGIPDIPAGEDRALVRALWLRDARVRHDPTIQVTVSGRVFGRAQGGMADAIRRRMLRQDEYTDEQVEPAADAFRRYSLRHRARCAWRGSTDAALARDTELPSGMVTKTVARPHFGTVWAALEASSATLQRRRVRFVDLPAEIAAAEALVHLLTMPELLAAD